MNYDALISTVFFLPSYLYLFHYYGEFARLYFYILISGLSLYEVIDKKFYIFDNLDLNQYNYVGDQCKCIAFQFFMVDIFFPENKSAIIHHALILYAIIHSFYLNQAYILALFLSLNEISTIFLSLKLLNIYKKTSNILFMFNFFIFRILLLPLLTFYYRHIYHAFIILLLDDILHLYWVIKLSKQFILFK
jgi:hypothetical protein